MKNTLLFAQIIMLILCVGCSHAPERTKEESSISCQVDVKVKEISLTNKPVAKAVVKIGSRETVTDEYGCGCLTGIKTGSRFIEAKSASCNAVRLVRQLKRGKNHISVGLHPKEDGLAGLLPGEQIDRCRQMYGKEDEKIEENGLISNAWFFDNCTLYVDCDDKGKIKSITIECDPTCAEPIMDGNGICLGMTMEDILSILDRPESYQEHKVQDMVLFEMVYEDRPKKSLVSRYSCSIDTPRDEQVASGIDAIKDHYFEAVTIETI